jgi:hypothetical protein
MRLLKKNNIEYDERYLWDWDCNSWICVALSGQLCSVLPTEGVALGYYVLALRAAAIVQTIGPLRWRWVSELLQFILYFLSW